MSKTGMSRFLVTTVVFVAITLAVFFAMNFVFIKVFNQYSIASGVARFSQMPDKIGLANVGGSHGECGFNYEDYPAYAPFNFAMSAQPLLYDVRMLDYYADHIADGALILIPMSHITLYRDFRGMKDFLAKNQEYYYLLDPSRIVEYDYRQYLIVREFPILDGPRFVQGIIRGFASGFSADIGDDEWTKSLKNPETAATLGTERAIGHYSTLPLPPTVDAESWQSVHELIALCREHGWQPVFVTTPVATQYYSQIPQAFIDDFTAQMAALAAELNVPHLYYAQDERFVGDLSNFRDSDHLNKFGARIFTDIVLGDIENLGITPVKID